MAIGVQGHGQSYFYPYTQPAPYNNLSIINFDKASASLRKAAFVSAIQHMAQRMQTLRSHFSSVGASKYLLGGVSVERQLFSCLACR